MNRILKRPVLQAASSSLCKILGPNAYNVSSYNFNASPTTYPSAGGQRNMCFQIPTNPVGISDVCSAMSAPLANPLHEIDACDKKGKEMEEHEKQIESGDVINLPDLLFTKNRDYLVRYIDNQRVMAEQLAGKIVVLFFVSLCNGNTGGVWGDYIRIHKDLYNDLKPENNYEIVFVGVNDYDPRFKRDIPEPHEYFEHLFSRMPWTAIPFSDVATRKRLQRTFGISENLYVPESFVVDSEGLVLFHGTFNVFGIYGTQGYPFSKEKIELLCSEDDAAVKQPSLKTLLGSSIRDYVISNTGDKVPINSLEDKVVALYFYEDGLTDDRITKRLERAYYKLAEKNKNFEVVFIYLSDTYHTDWTNIESFWEKFKTMPWLALPFKDPNHKKLKRLFGYELFRDYNDVYAAPTLVIFGAHGEFINPYGVDIILYADIQAYPFNRDKLAKLEVEKIKELKMEMLLDPRTVCTSKDGRQVQLCQLAGKRVILLFDKYGDGLVTGGSQKLLEDRYIHAKGSDDEFEVIHIVCHDNESLYNRLVTDVPWLLHPFGYSCASELFPGIFGFHSLAGYDCSGGTTCMIAFDQHGRVVRKTINLSVEDMDFPFYAGSMEEETFSLLTERLNWEYFDEAEQGIYSFKRTLR